MENIIIIVGIVSFFLGVGANFFYLFSTRINGWRLIKKNNDEKVEQDEPEKPDYEAELLSVYNSTLQPRKDENDEVVGIELVTRQLLRYETKYEYWTRISWRHFMICGALCLVGGSIGFFDHKILWFLALILCFQVPTMFIALVSLALMIIIKVHELVLRSIFWLLGIFSKKQEV